MNCPRCKAILKTARERYHYRESGLNNVWVEECLVFKCTPCNIRMALLPDPETAAREIVRVLVLKKRRLSGRAMLFLRNLMGLKGSELASILRVHRAEISRWENNQVAIEPINDFRLRLTAIDRLIGNNDESETLRKFLCGMIQHEYDPSCDVDDDVVTIPSLSRRSNTVNVGSREEDEADIGEAISSVETGESEQDDWLQRTLEESESRSRS